MQVRLLSNEYGTDGWFSRPIAEFWKEFSRDFDRRPEGNAAPRVDVVEDADAYRFYFEMPGLKRDSLAVSVDDGRLVIEGERQRPEWSKDARVHLAERSYGPLVRTVAIPNDASQEGIKASYRDGILEVTMPKKPETRPRKIKVSTEE